MAPLIDGRWNVWTLVLLLLVAVLLLIGWGYRETTMEQVQRKDGVL